MDAQADLSLRWMQIIFLALYAAAQMCKIKQIGNPEINAVIVLKFKQWFYHIVMQLKLKVAETF